jgi:hypothetical protein
MATDNPALGQVRVSNEHNKNGLFISPGGVRNVWLRNDMETFIVQNGIVLSEDQVAALERKKMEQEVKGEIETCHPGYLGAQDTYCAGTIKGVGRIYQQTFIDTYSKTVHLKLYDRKNALVAADIISDRVIPFYAIAFRKKVYTPIEQLQEDLDRWVYDFNYPRTHTGKRCYGKTPMQTFLDSLHLAKEKMLDQQYEKMNDKDHLSAFAIRMHPMR